MTKIYLGNLPISATEAEVREFFSQGAGEVIPTGTVTRVVGNDLFYVNSPDLGSMVFTPENIPGYEGEPLKKVGVFEGAFVSLIGNANFGKTG